MAGFTFDTSGFDELQNELKQLQKKAESLDGKSVSFYEMFPSSFMKKYTNFQDIDSFFDASGFNANTNEDFDKIPESELDSFVATNSKFSSWEEMLNVATELYFDSLS